MDGFDIIVAGIVATTAMVLVMEAIHRMGWANADMVRAVGSIFTRSDHGAFGIGLTVHYLMGILFAFAYTFILSIAPIYSFKAVVILSTTMGMVHGMVVGLLITIFVAEHHPLPRFREGGAGVVIAHKIGHDVYGVVLGLTLGLLGSPVARLSGADAVPVQEILGYSLVWILLFGVPLLFLACNCLPWVKRWRTGHETL